MSTRESNIRRYGFYVDGEFRQAASGETRESISPSTGKAWAKVPEASAVDVNEAVAAARAALEGPWRTVLPRERAELLRRLADLIQRDAKHLAEIEVRDNGKTIREMTGQYQVIPTWYRYYAGLADKIEGRTFPPDRMGMFTYTLVEPIDVVAGVTPWNSPGLQLAFKAAPALAAGNALVVKPSEQTPVATLETIKLFAEAGFPPGVVNVVTGGPEAGAALTGHPDVDLVVFTGSDATGRRVGAAAGAALSGVILELGGKSPQVVFGDADVDQAVVGVMAGICVASGQSCIAGSRVYVHESVVDEFTQKLVERFASLRLGDPLDWETEVGPVCFRQQLERITECCASAVEEGARVLVGGRRADGLGLDGGYYFEPTILGNVRNDLRAMREEIFGPVMGLMTFTEEDEAVALANDSPYGLAAGIWTRDVNRAHRLVRLIDAGTVHVNNYRLSSPQSPFSGFKDSGVGYENSQETLSQFTRRKTVWLDYSGQVKDPFKI